MLFKRMPSEGDKYEDQQRGFIMDLLFHSGNKSGSTAVVDEFLELKAPHRYEDKPGHSLVVATKGSFDELCSRACSPTSSYSDTALEEAVVSARSWLKLGKFVRASFIWSCKGQI
jgi:hypothetical protein